MPRAAPRSRIEVSPDPCADAHAVAETFATLTGFHRVPVAAAAERTLALAAVLRVEALQLADNEQPLTAACARGVMGGGASDALHATFARRRRVRRIVTRNASPFAHVTPDLEILTP